MVESLQLAFAPIPVIQCIVKHLKDGAAQRRARLFNRHWNNVIISMYESGHLNRVRLRRFIIEYSRTLDESYWEFGNSTDHWEPPTTKRLAFCSKSFPPDPNSQKYDLLIYLLQSSNSITHKFSNLQMASLELDLFDYSIMETLHISSCDCSSISPKAWFELSKLLVNVKVFMIELGWEPENCGSLVNLKEWVFWQLGSYGKLTQLVVQVRRFDDLPTIHAETIRQRKSKFKRICISQKIR